MSLKLDISNGYANIYVKSCQEKIKNCTFNPDLDFASENKNGDIIKSVKGTLNLKELNVPIFCAKNTKQKIISNSKLDISQQVASKDDSRYKDAIKSSTCNIAIGVLAPEYIKGQKDLINYTLSVNDKNDENTLVYNHLNRIRLLPETFKYYKFSIGQNQNIEKILVNVDTIYGSHEICITKSYNKPANFDDCLVKKMYNGINQGINSNYDQFEITSEQLF